MKHVDLDGYHRDRVAVGPSQSPSRVPRHSAAAGGVHNVDGRIEFLFQQHCHLAGGAVRSATSRPGADKNDRSVGIGVSPTATTTRRTERERGNEHDLS